ncbi:hypothetical protein CsSME_00005543 [Camellia sinensis var. sinensis]
MCKARGPVALFGAVCGNSLRGDRSQRGWGLMCGKSHIDLEKDMGIEDHKRWKKQSNGKRGKIISCMKEKMNASGCINLDHLGFA